MDAEEDPEEILCSLRKEMTFIKAEETLLKKQILSLNEQFEELMISVAELYPDILNEDFVQTPEARKPEYALPNDAHDMSTRYQDTLQRTPRKSRWNEWREGRVRRRFSGGDMELKEEHFVKSDGIAEREKTRPSSLNVNELSENSLKGKLRNSKRSNTDIPNSAAATPSGDATGAVGLGSNDYGLKLMSLDSERRRRIRQRLKESRKKLDVVHLGLF
ncbi:uncharacterized protein LOC116290041 [Actinia tenebrosa]|uniref:Uncharacterized protein LOC116290041 n=1 Tax=Actinia tenebrosa TaxID=6105 RepID=A0A6P8HJL9_ACTTE|nr:uncharacterized protein LOC116290041 [Actinia tenebrosa]